MKNILCFGDSNTFGYDTINDDRFPWGIRWTSILQQILGDEYRVIEEGMGGRTTVWEDPIENIQSGKKYLVPCLESHWPLDLVIIMLGTNDLKSRFALDAHDIAAGVENLAVTARDHLKFRQKKAPEILIISPIEVGEGIDQIPFGIYMGGMTAVERSRQFPRFYREVAKRNGFEFMAASDHAKPCREDAMHMDAENHRKLAIAVGNKVFGIFKDERYVGNIHEQ